MKLRKRIVLFIAATVLFLGLSEGRAAPIVTIDQQNAVDGQATGLNTNGVGQSFTPALNQIDAAEFLFAATSASLQLSLYAGSGIGGTLLGTSAAVSLTGGTFQTVHFDLLASQLLTPGSTYTLFVRALSGTFGQEYSASNPYSGGIAFEADGNPFPSVDIVFSEGLHGAGVPDGGSTLSLLGLASLGLVALRRKLRC